MNYLKQPNEICFFFLIIDYTPDDHVGNIRTQVRKIHVHMHDEKEKLMLASENGTKLIEASKQIQNVLQEIHEIVKRLGNQNS